MMENYKVTLELMIDPTQGDETENVDYIVEANGEYEAYNKAELLRDAGEEKYKYLSVYNYKVKKL